MRGLRTTVFAAGAGLLIGGGTPAPATAADAAVPASPRVEAFEQFVTRSGPLCLLQPAADCVDAGWSYADSDRDQGLSLEELRGVRGTLVDWTHWRGESLHRREKAAISFGVWLIDTVGLDALFASYDGNGDSALTQQELLSDVELDDRPLGQVLLDPTAVDRQAVSQRLGKFAPFLKGLLK